MTPTLWISLVLGLGGALGTIFTVLTKISDREREKQKQEGAIKLDEASYTEIASRAAKINSEERIETERWWKEQFDAVKTELKETREELGDEKSWRRRTSRRLRDHQPWDDIQYQKNPENGPPPPLLDEDDENGDNA